MLQTQFCMLVSFKDSRPMELQLGYLALFHLFSVIEGISTYIRNIQLMLELLKGQFLVLHFSFYTLMTFLMMFSVIFLSILIIFQLSLSVIGHLIFGNSQCWLLNLNLACGRLQTGAGNGFSNSMLETFNLFCFTALTTGAINVKMDGFILE